MLSLDNVSEGDRWITLIAVWQVVGGLISAGVFLDDMARLSAPSTFLRILCAAGVAAALVAVWSGFLLRKRRTLGLYSALGVQAAQVIAFSTGSTAMQLTLGPFAFLTLIFGYRYSIDVGMRPRLLFYINASNAPVASAAINLLALFCFVRLLFWEIPTAASPPSMRVSDPPAPPSPPASHTPQSS